MVSDAVGQQPREEGQHPGRRAVHRRQYVADSHEHDIHGKRESEDEVVAPPARRWEGYYAPCLGVGAGEGVKDGVRGHAGGAGTMGLAQHGAQEGI